MGLGERSLTVAARIGVVNRNGSVDRFGSFRAATVRERRFIRPVWSQGARLLGELGDYRLELLALGGADPGEVDPPHIDAHHIKQIAEQHPAAPRVIVPRGVMRSE